MAKEKKNQEEGNFLNINEKMRICFGKNDMWMEEKRIKTKKSGVEVEEWGRRGGFYGQAKQLIKNYKDDNILKAGNNSSDIKEFFSKFEEMESRLSSVVDTVNNIGYSGTERVCYIEKKVRVEKIVEIEKKKKSKKTKKISMKVEKKKKKSDEIETF